jgi:hypothetical protein
MDNLNQQFYNNLAQLENTPIVINTNKGTFEIQSWYSGPNFIIPATFIQDLTQSIFNIDSNTFEIKNQVNEDIFIYSFTLKSWQQMLKDSNKGGCASCRS